MVWRAWPAVPGGEIGDLAPRSLDQLQSATSTHRPEYVPRLAHTVLNFMKMSDVLLTYFLNVVLM